MSTLKLIEALYRSFTAERQEARGIETLGEAQLLLRLLIVNVMF